MAVSNERRDQGVMIGQDTHHNKRKICSQSPEAMRTTKQRLGVPGRSNIVARNPRICYSDVPKQCMLHPICVNELVWGKWPVLTESHLDEGDAHANKQID
jgi:hypothetical protein